MANMALPSGLLINIEKNILGQHNKNDGVLGYYDRIEIKPVYHWFDYSPQKALPGGGMARKQTISFYPIKLLFPAPDVMSALESNGLDYTSWQGNLSGSHMSENDLHSLFAEFPCVTVALVNLTDKFKGSFPREVCDGQLKRFAKVIGDFKHTLQGVDGADFSKAHCCVLPTLGYSDYCILLAEHHWNVAPRLMEYLHSASCATGTPALSTDYMLPVYHLAGEVGFSPAQSSNPDIQLSVRVNLHPGVSMKALAYIVRDYADVYQISGTADCMLVSRSSETIGDLLHMLAPACDGGDRRLVPMAFNTAAFLQRPIQGSEKDTTDEFLERSTTAAEQINHLRDVLKRYGELLKDHRRHTRQLNALYDQISVIENICGNLHNQSLQQIMFQWLEAFEYCLQKCISEIEKDLYDPSAKEKWGMVEEALSIFIDEAGSFLADLSRSDCFFMETEQYNHPSVGSATALLIAYNRWQNSFAKAVMRNDNSAYSFLIRSGGCDSTHTKGLFWFLRPTVLPDGKIQEHLPFIIQMSEAGLFDCCGTIFRMTHECMHFCGDRKRKERADYLIRFVAAIYGRVIAGALFDQSSTFGWLIGKLRTVFQIQDAELEGKLLEIWEDVFAQLQNRIVFALHQELTANLHHDSQEIQWQEIDYMTREFGAWVINQLDTLFTGFKLDEQEEHVYNSFVNALYEYQHITVTKFYEDCDKQLSSCGKELRFCALEARGKASKSTKDVALANWIPLVLNQLLIDSQDENEDKDEDQDQEENQDLLPEGRTTISDLRSWNIHAVMQEIVLDCFSETFADVEACIRLEATFADYILAFVFESWDLGEIGTPAYYRIPAVLKTCFPDALTPDKCALEDDAKKKLKEAIEALNAHGMPQDRISFDSLVEHLNHVLKTYTEELSAEAQALEDYLQLCKASYTTQEKGQMRPYREMFHKIRQLQLMKCKSPQEERLVGLHLFNALTGIKL